MRDRNRFTAEDCLAAYHRGRLDVAEVVVEVFRNGPALMALAGVTKAEADEGIASVLVGSCKAIIAESGPKATVLAKEEGH